MQPDGSPLTDAAHHLELASAAQQRGDLTQAKQAYRQALTCDPLHFGALHAIAVLCARSGQLEEALQWFDQALTVQASSAAAWSDRGNVLTALRRYTPAIASYDKAIELAPDQARARYNRAIALSESGQHEQAAKGFEEAIACDPRHFMAWCNQGVALNELKHHEAALQCFDQALVLAPDYVEAWSNKATALVHLKQYEEALACCEKAVTLRPDFADAWCNRGNALRHLDRQEEALKAYERAVTLNPALAQAWSNQGAALSHLDRPDEAMASFAKALELKPDYTQAWFNRGNAYHALGQLEEAINHYQHATTLDPSYGEAHWNKSLALLSQGRLSEGWQAYEWRKKLDQPGWVHRVLKEPFWDGTQSLEGRTILLHSEQGFGDTLQFCRYAERVAQRGATVLLEVQPALKDLMQSLAGPHQVFASGEALPPFDLHCHLLSLPHAFDTHLESIPSRVPYLRPDPSLVAHWRFQIGPDLRPCLGVVWSGNATHTNDKHRSMPLNTLLSALPDDWQWISLQKEVRPEDDAVLAATPALRHFGAALRTYADTAALCSLMDVVVCVDTSVAHLAGALGRPVQLLLPTNPDWRWLRGRSDTPWYPSMTLLRQNKLDDWREPLALLRKYLATKV
jgi:tetratricopeptide (TPR) repeat protein